MRRIIGAIVIGSALAACLAGPVLAQQKEPELTPLQQEDVNKKKDAEDVDRQYKRTLQRTNANAAPTTRADPWANMRGSDDSKAKK